MCCVFAPVQTLSRLQVKQNLQRFSTSTVSVCPSLNRPDDITLIDQSHCLISSVCPAGGWLTGRHQSPQVLVVAASPVISSQHHWRVSVLLHGPHRLRQPLVGSAHRSCTLHPTNRLVVRHFLKRQVPIILHCTAWRHIRQAVLTLNRTTLLSVVTFGAMTAFLLVNTVFSLVRTVIEDICNNILTSSIVISTLIVLVKTKCKISKNP